MKILVAEDNELIRSHYQQFLSEAGYDVHVASDGQEALYIYRQYRPFQVLITDRDMPNMNGLDLLDFLLEEPIDHRFLITTDDQNGLREQAEERRAEFIPKPIRFPELLRRLNSPYPE